MTVASRFLPRPDAGAAVHLTLDGVAITAHAGDTLAAALLAHSGDASRSTGHGVPRSAYCLMGVCFECLVELDGQPGTQACMVTVRDGMVVRRQHGHRRLTRGGTDA